MYDDDDYEFLLSKMLLQDPKLIPYLRKCLIVVNFIYRTKNWNLEPGISTEISTKQIHKISNIYLLIKNIPVASLIFTKVVKMLNKSWIQSRHI